MDELHHKLEQLLKLKCIMELGEIDYDFDSVIETKSEDEIIEEVRPLLDKNLIIFDDVIKYVRSVIQEKRLEYLKNNWKKL